MVMSNKKLIHRLKVTSRRYLSVTRVAVDDKPYKCSSHQLEYSSMMAGGNADFRCLPLYRVYVISS